MDHFEKSSRNKYRYNTARGIAMTEDLWDLPLTRSNVSLDSIAKDINRQIKENEEESFVYTKSTNKNTILNSKLEIVKHIIKVKLEELDKAKKREENRDRKEKIMRIIHEKQDEDLKNKDLDDLEKLLEEYNNDDVDSNE